MSLNLNEAKKFDLIVYKTKGLQYYVHICSIASNYNQDSQHLKLNLTPNGAFST